MKNATEFSCSACGHSAARWFGRCPSCDTWGSAGAAVKTGKAASGGRSELEVRTLDVGPGATPRLSTGIDEVDRVLGGGLVPGSAILLSGDPGIGKSTLILQVIDGLVRNGHRALMVSGEESLEQVSLRALRLGVDAAKLEAAASNSLAAVIDASDDLRPAVLVVDSIQTLQDPRLEQAAGSVVQVRECAATLVQHAKATGTAVIMIGHVTKEGTVAGPRTLEHLVDAVLSIDGERSGTFRLLRSLKNRFGSCDEVGVFTMSGDGMEPVADPSSMFLADRLTGVSGSAVFPGMEGVRPVLVEIQALVADSSLAQPRRVAIGLDAKRLALLMGVLTKEIGSQIGAKDVFVAAAGGIQVREPAADLPLAMALLSAHEGRPVDPGLVAIGEVGLAGEVRRVPGIQRRLVEAERLGFTTALVPPRSDASSSMRVIEVSRVTETSRWSAGVSAR